MADSLKAYGTVLEFGDTADHATSTVWTPVANVKSIKPPKITAKDIDTTDLTSEDEFDESIAGLGSGGEIDISLKYNATRTETIYGFFRTNKAYRIRYTDNSGWKINGYMNEIGDDEVVNGEIVMQSFKIKVSGKPVHAAAGTLV